MQPFIMESILYDSRLGIWEQLSNFVLMCMLMFLLKINNCLAHFLAKISKIDFQGKFAFHNKCDAFPNTISHSFPRGTSYLQCKDPFAILDK